jgi:hypothetical protein
MIRMPTNYPPLEAGKAIAGMGTPDLRGTFGTFAFYTDDPEEMSRSVSGGRIVKVPMFQNRAVAASRRSDQLPAQGSSLVVG